MQIMSIPAKNEECSALKKLHEMREVRVVFDGKGMASKLSQLVIFDSLHGVLHVEPREYNRRDTFRSVTIQKIQRRLYTNIAGVSIHQ
jgi:hypothetical protein